MILNSSDVIYRYDTTSDTQLHQQLQFLYVWGWEGKVSIVLESIAPSFYDLRSTGYLRFYQISTVVIFFTVYPSRHQKMKHSPL